MFQTFKIPQRKRRKTDAIVRTVDLVCEQGLLISHFVTGTKEKNAIRTPDASMHNCAKTRGRSMEIKYPQFAPSKNIPNIMTACIRFILTTH